MSSATSLRSLQGSPPINSLPVELLSLIFTIGTHGTDVAEDGNRPCNTQSVRTPVVISQVNRRWRQIALNTPALWTSLCATLEMVETWEEYNSLGQPFRSTSLNTEHLTSYLALSRNYPLDILIDARDPDWDFFEPEISDDVSFNSYTPPFSLAHMSAVIATLVPHLHRWRSISILTDSWAPMHIALTQINPHITSTGAPRLESLTLMRCNNFVSYAPQFQPADMKGPAFLQTESPEPRNLFPRLRRLTLRGVHVDWNTLAESLSCSEKGLSMLDLSSHCLDVRPSPSEFHRILNASPNITDLVISGSGPTVTIDVDGIIDVDCLDLEPVKLPQLKQVSLGYRSALEGQTTLGLFDAPNTETLTLEEVTYPGDPEEVNASSILAYIATGEVASEFDDNFVVTHSNHRSHQDVAVGTNDLVIKPKPTKNSKTTPRAAFPRLETALLKGVKSCPGPLHAFFHSVSNLQQLELVNMAMYDIYTLLPSISTSPTLPCCPCPQLEQLSIEGFDQLQSKDIEFIAGGLVSVRQAHGACVLEDIDIHIAPYDTSGLMGVVSCEIAGTRVTIHEPPLSCNPHESFNQWDTDLEMNEADAFELGGAFNDPVFDAYYANSALAR